MMNEPNWLPTIHHDGSEGYVTPSYPRLGEEVRLRLRVSVNAPIRRVVLRTFPDGEQMLADMIPGTRDLPVQWWEINLPVNQPITHYRFILDTGDGIWHYSAAGPTAHVPLDATDFRILADFQPLDWVTESVFYQIFPDRFANGDPASDPRPDPSSAGEPQPHTYPWEEPPPPGQPFPLIFYGGDLPGIEQQLGYLTDLGVNVLYLNPVFRAYSNHKYDVADYDQVDPHFGGDAALVSLRHALYRLGMRYILDIVPNHCGSRHDWFLKAQGEPSALEAEFFTFHEHPHNYESWLGVRSLPKLNYQSRELRLRMYERNESVFRRWLRPPFQADGWRVDVANMLGRQGATQIGVEISHGIRQAVKDTRHDAYLMGENFFDATAQLQGDQWDGVMNYSGFTHPVWFWLVGFHQGGHGFHNPLTGNHWPTQAMVDTWQSRLAAIPWTIALQQYNLLDSHDTPRIRTIVKGNDALHRLAVALLMTFPGIPGLYYGDEIGMEDTPGLDSRGCMVWDKTHWNHSLREFHQRLILWRRNSSVLQRGGFQIILVEPDTVAYQRESHDGRVLVFAHRSEKPRPAGPVNVAMAGIPDGTRFTDLFSGDSMVVHSGLLPLPELKQGPYLLETSA